MRFSIYSEIQYWGGKSPKRLYDEVIEQVVHADRLGYDAYGVIEHFFFPRFSISANPFALWGECAARTKRIKFRTLGHDRRARAAAREPHATRARRARQPPRQDDGTALTLDQNPFRVGCGKEA